MEGIKRSIRDIYGGESKGIFFEWTELRVRDTTRSVSIENLFASGEYKLNVARETASRSRTRNKYVAIFTRPINAV